MDEQFMAASEPRNDTAAKIESNRAASSIAETNVVSPACTSIRSIRAWRQPST